MRMAMPGGFSNLFSWRNMTVSPPSLRALSPVPMVTGKIGGAEASDSLLLASSETWGHLASSAFPAARAMAKARHVGTPHAWQLVLGNNLNISIPVRGIFRLLSLDEGQRLCFV